MLTNIPMKATQKTGLVCVIPSLKHLRAVNNTMAVAPIDNALKYPKVTSRISLSIDENLSNDPASG